MPASFRLVFSRADSALLVEIFGAERLSLINLINMHMGEAERREILLEVFTPSSILMDSEQRKAFFSLLRAEEAKQLLLSLGVEGNIENAYVRLVNLSLNLKQLKIVHNFFNVPFPDEEKSIEPLNQENIDPAYGLFRHQREAVNGVIDLINKPPYRVILHMPTGSGKTRTAMNVISQHLRHFEPAMILWLANSEELCEQAASEFISCWEKIGNRKVTVQRFWGQNQNLIIADGLVVAGFNKLYKLFSRDDLSLAAFSSKVKMIIIDEAHQAIAPTYRKVIEAVNAQNIDVPILGLTATPGRTWNEIDIDQKLSDYFSRRKISLSIEGYENPIDYLVAEGYLARPHFTTINLDSFSEQEISKIQTEFEIPENLLKKLALNQTRTLQIVSKIEDLAKRHKRVIVFATTVDHSNTLAIMLKMKGYLARSVSSETSTVERRSVIDWFKNDDCDHKILCNFGILTTGFDAPKTSAALIARPTKSLVLFSQMVGRAIRGERAGGNKEAEIVTVVDIKLPGFGNLTDSFSNWEDIWRD